MYVVLKITVSQKMLEGDNAVMLHSLCLCSTVLCV